MYSEKLDICLKNRRRVLSQSARYWQIPAADIASGIAARMASTGNRANAFTILIAGIALFHHAGAIITADMDFIEIAKYADIDVICY